MDRGSYRDSGDDFARGVPFRDDIEDEAIEMTQKRGLLSSARTSSYDDDLHKAMQKPRTGLLYRRCTIVRRTLPLWQWLLILAAIVAIFLGFVLGLGLGVGLNPAQKTVTYPGASYTLLRSYHGRSFFDGFNFFDGRDPTNGFVRYVDADVASANEYVWAGGDYAIMRPGTDIDSRGVPSIRIESTQQFTKGLFLLDIERMPVGCGLWPAFWTVGDNWPYGGEIDIVEGVNRNQYNAATLHTDGGCSMLGIHERNQTGTAEGAMCDSRFTNSGCGSRAAVNASLTFGDGFNANGGGIYVMDWRSNGIRVWFFPRDDLPDDLAAISASPETDNLAPDMRGWPIQMANFPNTNCNIDKAFQLNNIIFDLTFCGDWAGSSGVWRSSGCYDPETAPTCQAYIMNNADAIAQEYWKIRQVKVYTYDGQAATMTGAATASKLVSGPALATDAGASVSATASESARHMSSSSQSQSASRSPSGSSSAAPQRTSTSS